MTGYPALFGLPQGVTGPVEATKPGTKRTRIMRVFTAVFCGLCLCSAAEALADEESKTESQEKPAVTGMHYVKMETSLGTIALELNGDKAPISVANFLRYVDEGFYNGTIFHRVISNFMIQGGGMDAELNRKSTHEPIKNEWQNGLKNVRGSIAMARTQVPDSATSQFYINVKDNPALDMPRGGAAYAVFGRVVDGMDVVDQIRYVQTTTKKGMRDVPVEAVTITEVTRMSESESKVYAQKAEQEKAAQAAAREEWNKKLADWRAKATTTASGLQYVDLEEGTGESPQPTDTVVAHYTGWLTDGTKFDSSHDRGQPTPFPLNGVIKGWTEGVGSMKVGGKRVLIIPPDLAYGAAGRPSIPPNSTLVFEIELVEIKK
jgi:FKBP-type peptidyl-prolyl cis-trans isomerase